MFDDIGSVFLPPLSWSANEIYRQKGMQREIAFSSSDVLAVTTISMAPRVFLLFFSSLFLHLLFLTHSHTLTHRQRKEHRTTSQRDFVFSKGIIKTLTCNGY